MWVLEKREGLTCIFRHITVYSILCVLLFWILCGGETTTKSHNEFLFSGAIVSDI